MRGPERGRQDEEKEKKKEEEEEISRRRLKPNGSDKTEEEGE